MEQIFNYDILKSKGFKLVDDDNSIYFGDNYQVYSNETINVRVVSDKSKLSLDISQVNDKNNWFDLEIIKILLSYEKNSNNVIVLRDYDDFFQNYLAIICDLFNRKNYSSTKQKLEILEKGKIDRMFPYIKK